MRASGTIFSLAVLLGVAFILLPTGVECQTVIMEPPVKAKEEVADATCDSGDKPTALLASPLREEALISWLYSNANAMIGRSFLATGELYQLLRWDPRTSSLDLHSVAGVKYGGDIVLAERVISGEVSKVIFFHDPSKDAPDLNLLLRACYVAHVPIALNEASASLGLMALRTKRKAYLIFNPIAGQRDSAEDLRIIKETLEPQLTLEIIETKKDVDPADQAKELIAKIQKEGEEEGGTDTMILASGGDGTVSAIAGATMATGITFGIIPRGTANAFSVALGIPTEVRDACRNILTGNVRVVDGAMCNETPMILLAGVGFEAGMVENAPRELKNHLGPIAYVYGGVKSFFTQEPFKCKLDVDGAAHELTVEAITVANVAPPTSVTAQGHGKVIPDDGMLDVTIGVHKNDSVGYLDGLQSLLDLAAAAVIESPTKNENILCLRVKTITIECDPAQKLVVDGEMVEMNPIAFSVVPGGLRVLAPPG